MCKHRLICLVLIGILLATVVVDAARKGKLPKKTKQQTKQLAAADALQSRETDPPNFVRLVLMRLIYGIAVQMGVEERLSGFLNGAFVPPNADEDGDYGGLGDIGDIGDDLGGGGGDLFDF